MEHLFNASFWVWFYENYSPAAFTRAWWREMPRKRVDSDTHAEKR
jgi:hypothetical protein